MAASKPTVEQQEVDERLTAWDSVISEGDDRRCEKYESILKYGKGNHYGDDAISYGPDRIKSGDEYNPAVPLCFMVVDMLLPKILSTPADPEVVAEQDTPFYAPIQSPFMRAKVANGLQTRTDTEAAADMLNAAVAHYVEKTKLRKNVRECWRGAAWFGDYFLWDVDCYGLPTAKPMHPSKISIDPDATCLDDARIVRIKDEQTLAYVREHFELGDQVTAMDDTQRDERGIEPKDDESKLVCIEYWYEKQEGKVNDVEQKRVTDQAEYAQLLADADTWRLLKAEPQLDGSYVWTFERDIEVDMYPGGWCRHVRCNNVVLESYQPASASGALPLHHYRLHAVPGEFWSLGVYDIVQDLNVVYDSVFKNCLEDIEQNGPVNAYRSGEVDSIKGSRGDSRTKNIEVTTQYAGPLGDILMHYPAAETSASALQILGIVRELVEVITGQVDPRTSTGPLREASGALIREMQDGSQERLGTQQELTAEIECAIVKNWCYYLIENDTETKTYAKRGATNRRKFTFSPSILGGEDFDFRFDVITGDATAVPRKAQDRYMWYRQLIMDAMGAGEQVAEYLIDISGAPNGQELKEKIKADRDAAMQSAAQQPAGDDPTKDAKKALADFLAEFGESSNPYPPVVRGEALKALQGWAATGEVPDVSGIVQGLSTQQIPVSATITNGAFAQ